jgi:CubicO group peptidase (beta-lactamase class C family)
LCATKPLLAIAFAQLWERGLVAPDTPVADVLPEFGKYGKQILTFRHLLTHTAGLVPDPVQAVLGAPREQVFDAICAAVLSPRARPGRTAHYSRFWAWFLLAEAVRRLDGRDYSAYLGQEILAPAGIDDIVTEVTPAVLAHEVDRVGLIYDTSRSGPAVVMGDPRLVESYQPGIAGLGNAPAFGRLLESLLATRTPVLGPQTVAAVTGAHRVGLHDLHFDNQMSWGLGVAVLGETYGARCSPRTFGHTGMSTSLLLADPDQQLVITAIRNGMPSRPVSEERHRALVAAVYADLQVGANATASTGAAA